MKPGSNRFLPAAASLALFSFCASSDIARAANDLWNVTGPASWTTDTNWADASAPTSADVAIFKNGGEAIVASGDTIAIQNLRVVSGSLSMTGGSISSSTDTIRLGDYAFDSTVGTATLNMSGSSSITGINRVYFADGNNAGSTVSTLTATLSDTASVTATNQYLVVGRQGGTANVTLNNSSVIEKKGTSNFLIIGDGNLGIGTVTLKDSSLLKSATSIAVGNGAGSNGTLNVSSSSAQVTAATELNVGISGGKGSVVMTGGVITASSTGTGVVGGGNGGQGTVTLSNASAINAGSMKWKVGDFGGTANTGSASVTLGGSSSVTLKELTIGHIGSSTATASVTVSGSASLTVNNFVTLGRDDNATQSGIVGSLNLNGGTLSTQYIVKGSDVSDATKNLVNVNGGTIKALADQADFFKIGTYNAGRVYVNLQAGGLTFDTNNHTVGVQNSLDGVGGLSKTGSGTLSLDANSTYAGNTLVSAGTLLINGSLGSANVTVSPAATVGGTGVISGNLHLDAGSSLNVVNLADALSISGSVTFGGFGFSNITGWDFANAANGTYTLLAGSSIDLTNVSNVGIENSYDLGNGRSAYFQSGSLEVVIIPEPAAAVLGSLGTLFLLRRRRF